MEFNIGSYTIGNDNPTYFIADVAANHDGDLGRAKELIHMVAENGGQAAKFQHFEAKTIVSDFGFKSLGGQQSHQANWKKSVFDVYKDASLNPDWTPILKETCDKAGIHFFTSPYSLELVDLVDPYVPAYKIGSGDITWTEIIEHIARKGKPVLLATGASTSDEVAFAVRSLQQHTSDICVMQCNTNYTGSLENFKYIQLNVLKSYREMFPHVVLGLSDHTPGLATTLGAVALGARVIEKHFTDDTKRDGPDHAFSMDPKTWKEMIDRTRELENALGVGIKKVEENELQTVILQRRSIRAKRPLKAGDQIRREDLVCLRPCPTGAAPPSKLENILGKTLAHDVPEGKHLAFSDLRLD